MTSKKRLSGAFGLLSSELDAPEPPRDKAPSPAPDKPREKPELKEAETNKPVSKRKPRAKPETGPDGERLITINPDKIKSWRFKDRKLEDLEHDADFEDLLTSIAHRGQDTAIIVRPIKDKAYDYEEIAGFRRLNACRSLGINVKAVVRELSDREAYAIQIDENDKRSSPGYWRRAESLLEISEAGIYPTQEAMSIEIGIGRSTIANYIRTVKKMPKPFIDRVQLHRMNREVLFYLLSLSHIGDEQLNKWLDSDFSIWRLGIGQVTKTEVEKSFKRFLSNTPYESKEAPVKKDGAKTYMGKAGKLFSINRKGDSVLINILKDGRKLMTDDEIGEALQKIMDEKA